MSNGNITLNQMPDLTEVKKVAKRMPSGFILKRLMLSEPDKIETFEFYGQASVWIKLREIERFQ